MARRAARSSGGDRYTCRASYCEIYNEQVFDLLNNRDALPVREAGEFAFSRALLHSAVGAFISGFVLGLADRHQDNMLLCGPQRDCFAHIDFGYVAGQRPWFDANLLPVPERWHRACSAAQWGEFVAACGRAFAVLSDDDRRKLYDTTGAIDDGTGASAGEGDAYRFWRDFYDRVTSEKLDAMAGRGASDAELRGPTAAHSASSRRASAWSKINSEWSARVIETLVRRRSLTKPRPRVRTHVRNIYALVRVADEIVDGPAIEAGLDAASAETPSVPTEKEPS